MEYDILGRVLSKTSIISGQDDEVYNYTYIQDGNGLNALERKTAPNGYYTEYEYGDYNRVMSVTENIDNINYTTDFEYNTNGSVNRKINPGGFATRKAYTNEGYLDAITTDDYVIQIWRPETQNAKGIYTKFVLGNGQETTKTYNNLGMPTTILTVDGSDNYIQDLDMDWDGTNFNLLSRTDNLKDLTEAFTYDINRLATAQVTDMQASINLPFLDLAYLDNGNIDTKTGVEQYSYSNIEPHQVSGVDNPNHLISASSQNVTYTDFNSMEFISDGGGIKTLTLGYGADQQRRKQVLENNGSVVSTNYYAGSYEKISTAEVLEDGQVVTPAMEREVSYISSGSGVCAMWVVENGFGNMHYLHKDHLGSITAITDDGGSIVYEQNFDAWGRYRDPNTWEYYNNGLPEDFALGDDNIADWVSEIASSDWSWFRRGYTGHEMLPEFGIINMNGRCYDPVLGRMLQVDNFIQDPSNSHSYNRYSYVLNNPLKYTDPSGEKLTNMDILSLNAIGGGIALAIWGGPIGAAIGIGLISGGVQHFVTAANNYSHGQSWDRASYNAGITVSVTTTTNWGYTGQTTTINPAYVSSGYGGGLPSEPYAATPEYSSGEADWSLTASIGGVGDWEVYEGGRSIFLDEATVVGLSYAARQAKIKSESLAMGGNWMSDVYNSPFGRIIVPDFLAIGVGFNGIAGVGAGTTIEFRWITHGPEASWIPMITTTESVGSGFSVDATLNLEAANYIGNVNNITRSMMQTNSFGGGDFPTVWGSGSVAAGGKIGVTGYVTPNIGGSFIIGRALNLGAGLPAGPFPVNGAGGVSNTWILKDFYK